MSLQTALAHHQAGRLAEAMAIYQQILDTTPDDIEALRWLGSAAGQLGNTRLAITILSRGHALAPDHVEILLSLATMQRAAQAYEQALACYEKALALQPRSSLALYGKGATLQRMGRPREAMAALRMAVALAPTHAQAHLNLADLLRESGDADQVAEAHYRQAIAAAPALAAAHYGLGIVLYQQDRLQEAGDSFAQAVNCREDFVQALYNLALVSRRLHRPTEAMAHYRRVLEIDPEHVHARINLSALLQEEGFEAEAREQCDQAYRRQNVFVKITPGAAKTVLILFDVGTGNMNLTHLFDTRTTNLIDWMIEYATPGQQAQLPPYDLVFNAMGDPDLTRSGVTAPLALFVEHCARPVLNPPDKVARTARHRLPQLLGDISNLAIAPVRRYASAQDWDPDLQAQLPLLLRPIHTQGGVGMQRMTTPADLALQRERQQSPVYVFPFVDSRCADGCWRKYRVIFIDRQPYPYHLGISPNWMVHYYTADMGGHAWKLEEEKRFLQDPQAVLGAAAMQTLREIGARLDLDYAGVDFSLLPDGRVLVFEANSTMLVHPENADGPYAHKNAYVRRILDCFEAMLTKRIAS
ncbi:tetratricopeptide repeat protein [Bordetella sp. FB-8]|uniref:tetratricopeptide repeat protein n=1 Tax=Bordetella sp. FB-8 TaxID=1159870 RepID=UPI0018CA0C0F|nr:tetratricopeptide repeat protein [Bordetella sp. FB-8]